MKVVKPYYEILTEISDGGIKELQFIEKIARVCYKSEDKITDDGESAKKFVARLIKSGHEAMIEHSILTVKFVCDRGVSHELVRHRHCSFAQESTRYCNYSSDKFGNEIAFVEPVYFEDKAKKYGYCGWNEACTQSEDIYMLLLNHDYTPQEARAVLNNSLKTEIVVTANYREWRHIFKLRCAKDSHPQMRELMVPLKEELSTLIPIVFDDITY